MAGTSSKEPCLRCVLHVDNKKTEEKVIAFKDSTLKKCQQVQIARSCTNSKYASIVIPFSLDAFSGYHLKCYKAYTAISLCNTISENENPKHDYEEEVTTHLNQCEVPHEQRKERQLRSDSALKSSNTRGILEERCIFCEKKDRKHKGCKEKLHLCQSRNIESSIRADAEAANDVDFLGKISALDFVAKEVRYHQLCRIDYSNKAKYAAKSENSNDKEEGWHQSRKANNVAFESLSSFIDDVIIKQEEVNALD